MAPPTYKITNPWQNNYQAYSEIIDVRSPEEFAEDHIPGAINCPVLNDNERALVGTIYKQESPFKARKIGAALVSKNISHHIERHFIHKDKNYHPLIYCWRGGQRSQSITTVLTQIGWQTTLLMGGYRTYRAHVRQTLESLISSLKLQILCGYTGSAKTQLLQALQNKTTAQVLDLEALAHHRGSLLGQRWTEAPEAQPSQKWFESQLLRRLEAFDPQKPIWIESESHTIGRIHLPQSLLKNMKRSPVLEICLPIAERVKLLLEDYPHLIEHPEALKKLLTHLAPQQGKARIQSWYTLIDQGQWPELVTQLLQQHYDPSYQQSLKRYFRSPQLTITLEDLSQGSITRFVQQLSQWKPSPLSPTSSTAPNWHPRTHQYQL